MGIRTWHIVLGILIGIWSQTELSVARNENCPAGESGCAWTCYKPTENKCLQYNDNLSETVCGLTDEICGNGNCYDPTKLTCKGTQACLAEEEACGGLCYNPKNKRCANKEAGIVCNLGEEQCGWKCYDPKIETRVCVGTTLCPKGQSECQGQCYTAWHGSCNYNFGGRQVCTYGYLLCRIRGLVPF